MRRGTGTDAVSTGESETQRLRRETVVQYKRIAELESELERVNGDWAEQTQRLDDAEGIIDYNLKTWRKDVDEKNAKIDALSAELADEVAFSKRQMERAYIYEDSCQKAEAENKRIEVAAARISEEKEQAEAERERLVEWMVTQENVSEDVVRHIYARAEEGTP